MGKRRVIGLSGAISSGKTTAGRYLESLGFTYSRYSQVLQAMLKNRGLPSTRESLQQIGEEVYEGQGQTWLGSELIKRMPEEGDLVIDGLRHPEDHSFLAEKFGPDFYHIHIEAPEDIRRERYVDEGPSEEFSKADAHPVEANITKLAYLAHERVQNIGSIQEFLYKIRKVVIDYSEKEGRVVCQ